MNNYTDISKFPAAKGDLHKLQSGDYLLLKLFDAIAKKEGWTYWLDYGTLLGAVRHKGFIPWDDDMDISMPRKDYEKMIVKLPEYFNKMDLKMNFSINSGTNAVGIGVDHAHTGIFCDIFYYDSCYCDNNDDKYDGSLLKKIYKAHKYLLNHYNMKKEKIKKYLSTHFPSSDYNNMYFTSPQMSLKNLYLFKERDIFPLAEMDFEDSKFPVPNNFAKFLESYYGKTYMEYPHDGVCHHGGYGTRPPLADWAKINNIDMGALQEKIQKEIDKILKA